MRDKIGRWLLVGSNNADSQSAKVLNNVIATVHDHSECSLAVVCFQVVASAAVNPDKTDQGEYYATCPVKLGS